MSAQKTKCSTEDNNLYNEKLKQKITTQAKRLTNWICQHSFSQQWQH